MFDGSFLLTVWPWAAGVAYAVVTGVATAHVILNKRDVRAAIGWTGLIVLSPIVGGGLYYFFGINRLRRRAARLAPGRAGSHAPTADCAAVDPGPEFADSIRTLNSMVRRATGVPLVGGNSVECLINGDQAYPAMIDAIDRAERSVALATYIFDDDRAGRRFREALTRAVERGVAVRVLIDGVGRRYSRPPITRALARSGVPTGVFLPTRIPLPRLPYGNLRNHRKILVVDGRVGFTGGLNIREGCLLAEPASHPVQDVHFGFRGPVVDQMFAAFREDWLFATGERLGGPVWTSATEPSGPIAARGIADGPDEDFETIRWTILSALDCAEHSVRIVTPYFLPEQSMITALRLAALRGLDVDILLPRENNLRFVQWACTAQLWQVLEAGCRVWYTPPPFDHSKIMVIDDVWSLVGSANWDPRSLRLNFEFNVECYGRPLALALTRLTEDKKRRSRPVTLAQVDGRRLAVRLRDGAARLFAPYL